MTWILEVAIEKTVECYASMVSMKLWTWEKYKLSSMFLRARPIRPHFTSAYLAYISSLAWKQKRLKKLAQVGNKCEQHNGKCKGALQCHHKFYVRLGHERLADLQVLCQYHHSLKHQHMRKGAR